MFLFGRHIQITWKKWNRKSTLFSVHWWLFRLIVAGNLYTAFFIVVFVFFSFAPEHTLHCNRYFRLNQAIEFPLRRGNWSWGIVAQRDGGLRPRSFEVNHSSLPSVSLCTADEICCAVVVISVTFSVNFYLLYFEALLCYYVIEIGRHTHTHDDESSTFHRLPNANSVGFGNYNICRLRNRLIWFVMNVEWPKFDAQLTCDGWQRQRDVSAIECIPVKRLLITTTTQDLFESK